MDPRVRPLWRWLPMLGLVSCLLPLTASAAAEAAASGLAEARALLARIQNAANAGNYQGTMVFSVGGTMSSSRVGHYAVGDQIYEQLEALDGRQQRVLRHNDAVHTLWPQARLAVIERRETVAAWSTTPQAIDPMALDQYDFRRDGRGRVAGREAQVFLLLPRDELRYAQRLWADQATGLMLRADVIALAASPTGLGAVLESTAFSEIAIGVRPQADAVVQEIRNLRKAADRVVRPQQVRTSLEAEGWTLARAVSGFRLVGCVRRGIEAAGDEQTVVQAIFSDGLTHVSLFVEPAAPQGNQRGELQAQQGATGTLVARRGDHWITAVGDVPPVTLRLFADALERRRP